MKVISFLLTMLISTSALANSMADHYSTEEQFAKGVTSEVQSRPNYTVNASDYCNSQDIACNSELNSPAYRGASDARITNDATSEYFSNSQAQDIQTNFNSGRADPRQDPAYTHALVGQENAFEITHGMSNDYVDCNTGQVCHENLEDQFCHIPTNNPVPCLNQPYIIATTGTINWVSVASSNPSPGWSFYTYDVFPSVLSVPSVVERVVISNFIVTDGSTRIFINGHLVHSIDTDTYIWNATASFTPNLAITTSPLIIEVSYNGSERAPLIAVANMYEPIKIQLNSQQHDVGWRYSCSGLPSECQETTTTCVEGAETRYWEGVYTYLPCWKYQTTYHCDFDDSCGDLTDTTILDQTCSLNIEGVCVEQAITREVSTLECVDQNLQCGTSTFCLDGDCYNPNPTQSSQQEFNESVSGLAGLSAAGENLTDPPTIFQGTAMSCTLPFLGFSDCCQESGWGQDLGLAQCSESERRLADARYQKLTVRVGSYCASSTIFGCTRRKERYCVFDSKLARIIQQDGRRQIGRTFGSARSPNCAGLSPEELQGMDFSQMDFSDFYSDLNSNADIPNPLEIQNRIQQSVGVN